MNRCLLLLVAVALAGCAAAPRLPVADPDARWQERRGELSAMTHWQVKGRLGVRTRERGGSATVIWDRRQEDHRMELYGPFGGGRVRITQDALGAVMVDNKKLRTAAPTAEELLYLRVGWHVPFDAMTYWISGLPAPDDPAEQTVDEYGRLKTLLQAGWEVNFIDYRRQAAYELPRKIFARALPGTVHLASADGRDLGDKLEVRLVIKRWKLYP